MFQANMYVDVYRSVDDTVYSEYEDGTLERVLVYRDMPIHITPYRPEHSESSQEGWQATKALANARRNYHLRRGDEVRGPRGRVFFVKSVEETDGAFYGNSIVYQLTEPGATT